MGSGSTAAGEGGRRFALGALCGAALTLAIGAGACATTTPTEEARPDASASAAEARSPGPAGGLAPALSDETAARYAALALACVHREYPNKIAHVMTGPDEVGTPAQLHPAFFGCFDWHSAVHGHWLLVRLLRTRGDGPWAQRARAALDQSLAAARIEGEVAYLQPAHRGGYERPYGLAWLLMLAAEVAALAETDAQAQGWARSLAPLEALAAQRLWAWADRLSFPLRSGEHSQSAFAFGLALDWATRTGQGSRRDALAKRVRTLYSGDESCNLGLEPSGHDFLSPCLGAADVMRRVMEPREFAGWLQRALPGVPSGGGGDWLVPPVPPDRSDGKLVHLDGLNLSRAWMLEGIASGLPAADPRRAAFVAAGRAHATAGLDAVSDAHYAGSHWLGTFAVYLTTRAGVDAG